MLPSRIQAATLGACALNPAAPCGEVFRKPAAACMLFRTLLYRRTGRALLRRPLKRGGVRLVHSDRQEGTTLSSRLGSPTSAMADRQLAEQLAGELETLAFPATKKQGLENGGDAAPPLAAYSKRVLIASILGRPDGGTAYTGQKVVVGGWVKTGRLQGKNTFAFLELNDGSISVNLQVL